MLELLLCVCPPTLAAILANGDSWQEQQPGSNAATTRAVSSSLLPCTIKQLALLPTRLGLRLGLAQGSFAEHAWHHMAAAVGGLEAWEKEDLSGLQV